MRKYKFDFKNFEHYKNSIRKTLRIKYGEDFDFDKSELNVLKEIYEIEERYGKDMHKISHRSPYTVPWSILSNYNNDKFTMKQALKWSLDLVYEILNEYEENKSRGVNQAKDLTGSKVESKFNLYHNYCLVDTLGMLEGSDIVHEERLTDKDKKEESEIDEIKDGVIKMMDKFYMTQGIYFLYNCRKELLYIGKSIDLSCRPLQSSKEREGTIFLTLIETETYSDMNIYEMYYIAKFKPPLNKDSITEDYPTFELPELKPSLEMLQIREIT